MLSRVRAEVPIACNAEAGCSVEERKSAGRMPAVLKTAEESIRLIPELLDQGKKKPALLA